MARERTVFWDYNCHREPGHGEGCIVEYALHAFQSCVAVPPDSEVINAPDAQPFGLPPLTESINALADDSELAKSSMSMPQATRSGVEKR